MSKEKPLAPEVKILFVKIATHVSQYGDVLGVPMEKRGEASLNAATVLLQESVNYANEQVVEVLRLIDARRELEPEDFKTQLLQIVDNTAEILATDLKQEL